MPHSSKHKKGRSEHRGARRVSSKNVISKRTARFKYTVHHSKDVKRKLKKKGVRTIALVSSAYHELGPHHGIRCWCERSRMPYIFSKGEKVNGFVVANMHPKQIVKKLTAGCHRVFPKATLKIKVKDGPFHIAKKALKALVKTLEEESSSSGSDTDDSKLSMTHSSSGASAYLSDSSESDDSSYIDDGSTSSDQMSDSDLAEETGDDEVVEIKKEKEDSPLTPPAKVSPSTPTTTAEAAPRRTSRVAKRNVRS
jgi:hypothetical protein